MLKRLLFGLMCIVVLLFAACQSPASTPIVAPTESSTNPTPEPNHVHILTDAPAMHQQPVKIAFLDRLDQPEVIDELRWVKLALADFNTASDMNIELVETDSGNGADTAQSAATEIGVARDIYGVVGLSYSSDASGAGIVFQQYGLPCISLARSTRIFRADNPTIFRFAPTDEVEGLETGQLVADALDVKKAFVIYESGAGPYYQILYNSFVDTLTNSGATMVGREPITAETKDFAGVVAKIQSSGADLVFLGTGTVEQAGLLAREMREKNVNVPVVGYSYFSSADYSAVAEGNYVISPAPAVYDVPEAADAIQSYIQTYGNARISLEGPLAYAATKTMLKAMQRAADSGNLTPRNVADEISKTNRPDSILGMPVAFDSNGELKDAQFYLLKVENGKFKTVAPAH